MRQLLIILFLTLSLSSKTMTPNDVYSLSVVIQEHMHYLLKHYDIKHYHTEILQRDSILSTKLKPRNTWQKSYEILVKINMQRLLHDLPRIEPVGVEAHLNLNPNLVYEMNKRIIAELEILEVQNNIKVPDFKTRIFNNKTPLDNYNVYVDISAAFDELNRSALTASYVFSETMRIYDDITIILNHLRIKDNSLPDLPIPKAVPRDAINTSFEVLAQIEYLQTSVGIVPIDFFEFKRENTIPSDVYTVTGLIISELQTIKAYIGLVQSVTPPAIQHSGKKPKNVEQLMRWNLKRLQLIRVLRKGAK